MITTMNFMDKYSLIGIDGNAYSVMGYVTRAMRREGMTSDKIGEYLNKARSSDYNHLLAISADILLELNNKQ